MKSLVKLAVALCGLLSIGGSAAAQTVCSGNASLDGGEYIFQSDEWNSSLTQCATIDGIGFTLTTADFNLSGGAPATYPSVYRGCHWGDCTSSNPFPIEMSNLASATSSVTITQPGGIVNDSAYDIWFNQSSTTSGQPNGTEVMIWINHQGATPFGSEVGTVSIDGISWTVWDGRQTSWNCISYVANPGVDSVNLNLIPFFNDAISRGQLQSSWWLIDVEFGFEVWQGGQGLSATNFSVSAAAGGSTGNKCTSVPSAPSGLTGTVASSSAINLAWTADTAPANCTISSYNVYQSTSSGFTPSSSNEVASGVTATSYSATGLAASTTYYYAIEAVDAAGTSQASSEAAETTAAASTGCTPTAIVPYISVNGGSTWTEESSATVSSTTTAVDLGPQPISGGTWSWTGPNGFTSTARQINSIALSTGVNNYVATYTNTSSCKSTQTFAITVSGSTSGFSFAPSASSLSVKQGASGTDTITVADAGGFTGSVAFTVSGLPSGVTASFSPTSSATSSVLTLTASSTATTGAFTVTVTGTSGSTTESTSFTLDVTTGSTGGSACTVDYTISPQNSSNFGGSITIVNGGSTTLSNWVLTWSFANGQTISSSWNGTVSQSGANVTVSEQSGQTWENIPAGGSYSGFGFNGTWNGTTNSVPAAFSLNGTACTVN